MDGWIIDGVMYINTGQVSRKTKTKESPTDSRPSSPTGKKKKKRKKETKDLKEKQSIKKEANPGGIPVVLIDLISPFSTYILACLLPTERSIKKHRISYYTGLYNLISRFSFFSFFLFFCRLFSICPFSISILASSPLPFSSSFFQASRHSLYSSFFSFLNKCLTIEFSPNPLLYIMRPPKLLFLLDRPVTSSNTRS